MAVADGRGRPQGVCGDDSFPLAAQADPAIAGGRRTTPTGLNIDFLSIPTPSCPDLIGAPVALR
jgi:hypothetical protein